MPDMHVIRLIPGEDLKLSIENYANEHGISAGWIVTCVGSLSDVLLRFANSGVPTRLTGFFEILSVTGTVSKEGCHLHCCVSDGDGKVTGGHLLAGSIIYTTAEIVMGESKSYSFSRVIDSETGYKELLISKL